MTGKKVIRIGQHTVTVPGNAEVKAEIGRTYTEAEAVEIARAMGAAPPATPTLKERVEQARAALSGGSSDEELRSRAKQMESTMRAARARLGGRPPDDPEAVADRAA